MKRVKNELFVNDIPGQKCDDDLEEIEVGERAIRVGYPYHEGMAWMLVLHPKCAKDLGGDLMLEIAR